METKDVKLPLRYSSHRQIVDAEGGLALEVFSGASRTTEAADQLQDLVVVACNSHSRLVKALRDIATNARAALDEGDALAWAEELGDIERDALAAIAAVGAA